VNQCNRRSETQERLNTTNKNEWTNTKGKGERYWCTYWVWFPPFSHTLFPERARLLTIDDPIGRGKLVTSDIYISSRSCETHPLTYLHSEAEDPLTFPKKNLKKTIKQMLFAKLRIKTNYFSSFSFSFFFSHHRGATRVAENTGPSAQPNYPWPVKKISIILPVVNHQVSCY